MRVLPKHAKQSFPEDMNQSKDAKANNHVALWTIYIIGIFGSLVLHHNNFPNYRSLFEHQIVNSQTHYVLGCTNKIQTNQMIHIFHPLRTKVNSSSTFLSSLEQLLRPELGFLQSPFSHNIKLVFPRRERPSIVACYQGLRASTMPYTITGLVHRTYEKGKRMGVSQGFLGFSFIVM